MNKYARLIKYDDWFAWLINKSIKKTTEKNSVVFLCSQLSLLSYFANLVC